MSPDELVQERTGKRNGDGRLPGAVANAAYIETMYARWQDNPRSVTDNWQAFFSGFELAQCPRVCVSARQARLQSNVASLMYAYRSRGHLIARLDPLGDNRATHPDLELEAFELGEDDLDTVFDTGHLGGPSRATLGEILDILKQTYCGSIGVEYVHIQDVHQRRWLQSRMEPVRNRPSFSRERRLEILQDLSEAERFETFLFRHYPGQKRFSLEGAETVIPAIHAIVEMAPEVGIEEIVFGMTHRGRLNVLANILDKSYAAIFSEFEDNYLPGSFGGDGDVKYHKGYSSDHVSRKGRKVHLTLTANPSHLEAVNPVVEGRTRAKQRQRNDSERRKKVLPLIIHGDAAFSGQGLVAETLNLSQLPGYRTGGTVHFIINNQIGFTTLPEEGRSSLYPTDVAKMIEAPIFHVNGDDPEAVIFATEMALQYRQEFGRDVVVDMFCYRRHGHNEGDEPAFTQPVLYEKIENRPSVYKIQTERLVKEGVLTEKEAASLAEELENRLEEALEEVRRKHTPVMTQAFEEYWKGLRNPYSHFPIETGAGHGVLTEVARALTAVPEGFHLNSKIKRHLPKRMKAVEEYGEVDWAFAESLAWGALLYEGVSVRLSGQDSARGTFSQRHAAWQDTETQETHIPLQHIREGQARFCVYNSMLSEAAVLGFDYGYALSEPRMLVMWEAQFGDFSNGAQVIIDQFITPSESKWQRTCGLVMLLPHGYEGQGPEHSNAYLDRYLAACAEDNIQVCNPTTPAQYFHVLRRQMRRNFRRPLILMTPKSLLRHPKCVSPVDDLIRGRFQEALDDSKPPRRPRRLVLCSGKVYYDLIAKREDKGIDDVAIVRIEQFYPFNEARMAEIGHRYHRVEDVVWVQEEPRNRGGWVFMRSRLQTLFPDHPILYVGRAEAASPAVGSLRLHRQEQDRICADAFTGGQIAIPKHARPSLRRA